VIHGEHRQLGIVKRWVYFFHVVENVPLGDEKILPAVVIKIFEANSPS